MSNCTHSNVSHPYIIVIHARKHIINPANNLENNCYKILFVKKKNEKKKLKRKLMDN